MKKKFFIPTILLLTLAAGLLLLLKSGTIRFNHPLRLLYPVHGLDISHHQGTIDWKILEKQDFDFVYMKATEGTDWVDPRFREFWKAAGTTEMKFGAYHFYRTGKTGTEQARHFIRTVPRDSSALPPVIDLEDMSPSGKSRKQIRREIKLFIDVVESHYRKEPVIYASSDFYQTYIEGCFPETRVWIPDLYGEPSLPDRNRWTIWQFAHTGRIPGISRPVDLNVFRGSRSDFEEFCER